MLVQVLAHQGEQRDGAGARVGLGVDLTPYWSQLPSTRIALAPRSIAEQRSACSSPSLSRVERSRPRRYVRGPSGKLEADRIHDDVNPPLVSRM
jgi:hypothetical protein